MSTTLTPQPDATQAGIHSQPAIPWTAWAVLAFLLTRAYLLLYFVPQFSDLQVYFGYAVRGVDLGQIAYRDFAVEYPPLAYCLMTIPRWLSGTAISADMVGDATRMQPLYSQYVFAYHALMLLLDVAALLLLAAIVRRRRPEWLAAATWTYVLATAVLGHVFYDRLDLGLLVLLLGWGYSRIRADEDGASPAWATVSHFLLGASVAFKLISVVAIPFVLLADWRGASNHRRAVKAVSQAGLTCFAGIAFPFLVHLPTAGFSTLEFLAYHGQRGLQIESIPASIAMLGMWAGSSVTVEVSHGSVNLGGPLAAWIQHAATAVLAISLVGLFAWAFARGRRLGKHCGYHFAIFAIVGLLVLSKVLSTQFFVFAIPLLILLAIEVRPTANRWLLGLLLVAMAGLSTAVLPYLWLNRNPVTGAVNEWALVPDLHPLPCTLLLIRNAALAAIVVWLGMAVLRRSQIGSAAP